MENTLSNTTIAAISTAANTSGIGIVRMSGPQAMEILARVYRSKNGRKDIRKVPSHTIHYGFIYHGQELCDEVLVMIMYGPHTYTGENTVEIDCHGGVLSMKRVLEAVLDAGARLAEPGEFTKRAFLNGRMDLSQAEAVMDVIESSNDLALRNSLGQLKGSLKTEISQMRKGILHEVARIESALDDPEHYSLEGYADRLQSILQDICRRLEKLIGSFENGRLVKEGIRTAIIGKPNAGKSSLLNLLLRQERAIVTEIAGTTRDILEDDVRIGNVTLRIMDTAGIHSTEDIVEKIGVEKAKELTQSCDLILYVMDSSTALDENDYQILDLIKNKQVIIVYNKTDLPTICSLEDIEKIVDGRIVPLSAKEGRGLSQLEENIQDLFFHEEIFSREEVLLTNLRHKELIQQAKESVGKVLSSIELGLPEDFYTIDMMDAYESLGKILGEALSEDLVDEIFSKFCMGK